MPERIVQPRRAYTPYSYRSVRNERSLPQLNAKPRRVTGKMAMILVVIVLLSAFGIRTVGTEKQDLKEQVATKAYASKTAQVTPAPAADKINHCENNSDDKTILISISQRHMWVCEKKNQVYQSAVITGNNTVASDATPTGTFHIFTKESNVTLNGPTWSDPVKFWMPFFENQYGTYGFHDATWRQDSEFGTVAPDTSKASHGCIELPLGTSTWLYNWAGVGTSLTITA